MLCLQLLSDSKPLTETRIFATVVIIFAALPAIFAYPTECDVPPHREGMFVAYGNGYIEYICPATAYSARQEFRLRCINRRWEGHVPQSCQRRLVIDPPTRPPTVRSPAWTTIIHSPTRPQSTRAPRVIPWLPATTLTPTSRQNAECGALPVRDDMLAMPGYRNEFVDYYCRPRFGQSWQPVAYRLRCLHGQWQGHLPMQCPQSNNNY